MTRHKGQYRITLPKELLAECEMEDVEFVDLQKYGTGWIMIGEYYGKRKEKRDISEDKA